MDLLKRYKRDEDRITNGFKFVLGKDSFIRLARMHDSNPQFKARADALARQRQHEIANLKGQRKTEAYGEVAEEAFKQVCITEIHNVQLGDDVIECNDIGIARLQSEVPELWASLMQAAMSDENYVGEFDEDASLKN